MPAVGIDSINLSSNEVDVATDFLATGFFLGFLIVGFLLVLIEGLLLVIGLGAARRVAGARGTALLDGAGITFVDFSPLPRRPSMTIWPSWV